MSQMPAGKRAYRNPIADLPDQVLFFVLFLAGAAAIWFLKAHGFDQVTVTAVPVGLMAFYVFIALVTKRYRLREDKVGDNIYYLGFLYTLVSLAHALYIYNPDGTGATAIITNFGIAISTTIIGLAGRVFFNQMREDPVEYEREARYSLAEAINSMHAQLGDIATEASIFKRKLVQILEEGVAETAEAARASLAESVERFGQSSNQVMAKIEEAFASFIDHSTRLNESAAKNVDALEGFVERIEAVDVSREMLARKFDPVVEAFREAAAETTKRNRAQTNDMKRVRDMIETTNASAESLRKLIEGTSEALSKKLETASAGLERAGEAADRLFQSVQDARQAIGGTEDGEKKAGSFGSLLQRETEIAQEAAQALHKTFQAHRSTVADMRNAVENDLKVAQEHREAMARLLAESREGVQTLERSLVSLTRTLVEQIGAR